jgi:hypothetical protein
MTDVKRKQPLESGIIAPRPAIKISYFENSIYDPMKNIC